ncbi:MAG: hypothetical protein ACREXU_02845 [Gammaproteobacteria bacterium]
MPDILIRVADIGANAEVHPFEDTRIWKFRRCPYPRGLYTILIRSDGGAGGLSHEVKIGTTEVVQRSDTSVGGTDGVIPTPDGTNSTPAHQFYAEFNDEIDLALFEEAAVATTDAMIWANVEPA